MACGDLGISSGAWRRRVNLCPPETPRNEEKADSREQTDKLCCCDNKTKQKMNLDYTHHQPEVKTSTLPESERHGQK